MGMLKKATRAQARLRWCTFGPAKAGKSFSSLRLATALADIRGKALGRPGRVAAIDTERGSLSRYVGDNPDGIPFEFDVIELANYSPSNYTTALREIHKEGYDCVVIDSLSHAWEGTGGALDLVDKKKDNGNSYTAWKDVTPMHREMVDTILGSPCDVFATMRVKMEYVLEKDERGKMVPKRLGLKPIQREGIEYEFDIVSDIDHTHTMTVSGSRCHAIDGMIVVTPGGSLMVPVHEWLTTGVVVTKQVQGAIEGSVTDPSIPAKLVQAILQDAVRIGWGRQKLDDEIQQKYRRTLAELTVAELQQESNRLARLPDRRPLVTETMDIPPKRVTDAQLQTIKALQTALFAVVPDKARQKEEWKSLLGRFKVDSARDLTEDDAKLFCVAVDNRVKMIQEGGDPFGDPASVDTPANATSDNAEATTTGTPATPPTT